MKFTPYETRSIRPIELWEHGVWRLKVYGLSYRKNEPSEELIHAAKHLAAERISRIPNWINHYSVGFMGIHAGRTSNFVFIDWWADENELHHHVYVSPLNQPSAFDYMTPSGLSACVWDLRLIHFEREAWVNHVLKQAKKPDFEGYLADTLNEVA